MSDRLLGRSFLSQFGEPLAPNPGRRQFCFDLRWLIGAVVALRSAGAADADEPRYTIAFANITEEPGVTIEGTGFTGPEVRESFALAARRYPVDLIFYDNRRDNARALANAEDAIAKQVKLYILYHHDAAADAGIRDKLKKAGIPMLTINTPVPDVPLYTIDNEAAGRLAGAALGEFGARNWRTQPKVAVIVGPLGARANGMAQRAQGITDALKQHVANVQVAYVDTHGNPAQVAPLLGKILTSQPASKLLVAALDDTTALATKSALEAAGRMPDAAIVSHGVDRSIHGGMNDKKELDPSNRGSIVIGSVAFYLDRLGYDVLPLAMRMLRGEPVPPRTTTRHKLVTAANVFLEYPPYDMN